MVSFIQLGLSQIFKANGIVRRRFLKIVLFIFLRKYLSRYTVFLLSSVK